jgi:hypothetical protein
MKRIKSTLFSVNRWDAVKAAAVGILSTFVASLTSIWAPGLFPTWRQVLSVFLISAVGYLGKQFLTNSQGLPKPEPTPTDETFNTLTDSPDSRV